MRRCRPVVLVLALLAGAAQAESVYLCSVSSSGTSVNSYSAGCSFSSALRYEVQCSDAAYVAAVPSLGSVATTNDKRVAALARVPFRPDGAQPYAAVLSVGSSAACRFYVAPEMISVADPGERSSAMTVAEFADAGGGGYANGSISNLRVDVFP